MNDKSNTGSEDFVRGLATLALVSIGVFLVTLIFFWPLLLLSLATLGSSSSEISVTITIQLFHLLALIYIPFPYLYIHRKLCHPIRLLLMPLVSSIARSESIREKEITWYNKCASLPETRDANILLGSFKHSIRRDMKRKLRLFFRRGITTQTLHSDFLSLREDIPIIYEHEKRAVQGTEKSSMEEFIKRFLVVFLTSNAYIDRYYDNRGQCCALGLFVQSGKVLNNFVYFCRKHESQSGIWQYHHFRGLLRAVAASSKQVQYINFQIHQNFAKRLAGACDADYRDEKLLKILYPFALFKEPPANIIQLEIPESSLEETSTESNKKIK